MLFGGRSTREMKQKLSVPDKRALADFLPEVTITAKQLANAITTHNVNEKKVIGEPKISSAHQKSNKEVRGALVRAGIYPEKLPPAEDIKKVESRLKAETKKLSKRTKTLKEK